MASPTIETAHWLAIRARVETLALGVTLPIAWPNEAFTPPAPNTNGYLRVTWIPNQNRRLFLSGSDPHQRLSILQIDLFAKRNQNIAVATELAGKIAAHFPADLVMTAHGVTVRVQSAPRVGQPIDDETFVLVPVIITLEAFA